MPLFHYCCRACGQQVRKLLTPEQAKAPQECKCGGELARESRPPTSRVVERLDNGIMPRALERLADAERIYRDHTKVKR